MEKTYTSIASLFVALILFNFAIAESEINGVGLDKKSTETVKNETTVDAIVESVKNVDEGKNGAKLGIVNLNLGTNDNLSKESGSKKEEGGDIANIKNVKEEIKLPEVRKQSTQGEECDSSSISCTDDKKTLVACLRVPGDDPGESTELSLLIQNKEKKALTIKISAPNFVHLEKNQIQIQENEDTKVRVYIKGIGTDNFIVLNGGNGDCKLDFKDFMAMEVKNATKFTYISFIKPTHVYGLIFLGLLILFVSPWICIKLFGKRKIGENGEKYVNLDMDLPVRFNGNGKVEDSVTVNDGWDDNWGDSWDDEEAPKMTSLPVTPSFSSRRLSKDGWKD